MGSTIRRGRWCASDAAYDYAACVLMLVIARYEAQPAPISDIPAAARLDTRFRKGYEDQLAFLLRCPLVSLVPRRMRRIA